MSSKRTWTVSDVVVVVASCEQNSTLLTDGIMQDLTGQIFHNVVIPPGMHRKWFKSVLEIRSWTISEVWMLVKKKNIYNKKNHYYWLTHSERWSTHSTTVWCFQEVFLPASLQTLLLWLLVQLFLKQSIPPVSTRGFWCSTVHNFSIFAGYNWVFTNAYTCVNCFSVSLATGK